MCHFKLFLHFYKLAVCGEIIPTHDRTIVLDKGENTTVSWKLTPKTDEVVVSLSLYDESEINENKLWHAADKILRKNQEMFNGRLKVDYANQEELKVTLTNAMFNDCLLYTSPSPRDS